jgi:hypothetical protein
MNTSAEYCGQNLGDIISLLKRITNFAFSVEKIKEKRSAFAEILRIVLPNHGLSFANYPLID